MTNIQITTGNGNIEHETEKAILHSDWGWIPKSQITIDRGNGYQSMTIEMPYWLAKKLGIIAYRNFNQECVYEVIES